MMMTTTTTIDGDDDVASLCNAHIQYKNALYGSRSSIHVMQNTNRLQIIFIELCSISITEMQTTNGINSQLSITHSDRQDSGVYKCVAENPFGKSEHVIYVAVQGMYISIRSASLSFYF